MERSSYRTRVEEHDLEARINWQFGNCSWRGQRPIVPEIVEVTVAVAENAGSNVQSSLLEDLPASQEQFPNSQLIRTSESCSSIPVHEEQQHLLLF